MQKSAVVNFKEYIIVEYYIMAFSPPINTLDLNTLNTEECQICLESLYMVNRPVEINTCHHRFHRDCLYRNCRSLPNNLQECRCPVCRGVFNFNRDLTKLTQQVQDRLRELGVLPALAPPAVAPQRLSQQEKLMRYTQMNYEMDRIINTFVDCSTGILDDCASDTAALQKFLDNSSYQMKKITDNYKSISVYRDLLRESLVILNTINNRLQNPEFADFLQTREGGVFFRSTSSFDKRISKRLYQILKQCFLGTGAQEVDTIYQRDIEYDNDDDDYEITFRNDIFSKFVEPITLWFVVGLPNYANPPNWEELGRFMLPLGLFPATHYRTNNVPSLQFFQRYFQCYLDALTALSQINCDEVFRGGKQTKRTNRKTKKAKITKNKRKPKTIKRI